MNTVHQPDPEFQGSQRTQGCEGDSSSPGTGRAPVRESAGHTPEFFHPLEKAHRNKLTSKRAFDREVRERQEERDLPHNVNNRARAKAADDRYLKAKGMRPVKEHPHAKMIPGKGIQITKCTRRHGKHERIAHNYCGKSLFLSWPKSKTPAGRRFMATEVGAAANVFMCKMLCCPRCRPFILHRDWVRINQGLLSQETSWWYVVLTINKKRWKSGRDSAWTNSYRALQRLRGRLETFLCRRTGISKAAAKRAGWKMPNMRISEQHKNGWPHFNLAITWTGSEESTITKKQFKRWLKDTCPQVGLGHSVECSIVKPEERGKLANYFNKKAAGGEGSDPTDPELRRDLEAFSNEINTNVKDKSYQLPTMAPKGSRRISSSRGLIPPIKRGNGESEACFLHEPEEAAKKARRKHGRRHKRKPTKGYPATRCTTRAGVRVRAERVPRGEAPVQAAKRTAFPPSGREAHGSEYIELFMRRASFRGDGPTHPSPTIERGPPDAQNLALKKKSSRAEK